MVRQWGVFGRGGSIGGISRGGCIGGISRGGIVGDPLVSVVLVLCCFVALDSRAKDLEEIKQLTGEIDLQVKTGVGEVRNSEVVAHHATPSVSSMGSVVDLAP